MTKRKTTPHLKRGPKPKPKLPKRGVGRPAMPLCVRPYRYLLAYYEAVVAMGLSRRRASVYLQTQYKGPHTATAEGCGIWVRGPYFATKNCDRLRALAKWHTARPDDLVWLMTMSDAVQIAFGHPDASEALSTTDKVDAMLRHAASANETAWARQTLLPMLVRQQPAVPELADNFSPA